MKEITIDDVKRLFNVKIGYHFFSERARLIEWTAFKRMCNERHWSLKKAYEYLIGYKW